MGTYKDPMLDGLEGDRVRVYRARDPRCRCAQCKRWMRFGRSTVKTPAARQSPPYANLCAACHNGGGSRGPFT
jgi:hypothetical protein